MNDGATLAANHLAQNLENLRRSRGLTQGELAKIASIPRSTLTHLESGGGNPTLANLVKIAQALQVSLEELLARPREEIQLVSKEELQKKSRSQGQVSITDLLPDPLSGLEMDRLELKAGATYKGTPHLKGTKEYFHCVQGSIIVRVSGESYTLGPGDVLAFPGDTRHSYQNAGTKMALGIGVVCLAPGR